MIICLFVTSCKTKHIIIDDNTYEYTNVIQSSTMMNYEYMYNKEQLDSALVADELPLNISDWIGAAYIDYETNKPINQYMYYKLNDNNEITIIYKINIRKSNNDNIYIYEIRYINK